VPVPGDRDVPPVRITGAGGDAAGAPRVTRTGDLPARWHLLTGEYPPTLGGVADFTRLIARELARAGVTVDVWYPRAAGDAPDDAQVSRHAIEGGFSWRGLRPLARTLARDRGRSRLLVQWVPHSFGWRSMNVSFVAWLAWRAWVRRDQVEVIAHEPGLDWNGGLVHRVVALVHRAMAAVVVNAARRICVSIPAWEERLRPLAIGDAREFRWLPIPNVIPVVATRADALDARARFGAAGAPLVLHFGTYGAHHLPQLEAVFERLLTGTTGARLVLAGPGGDRLLARLRSAGRVDLTRITITGALDPRTLSALLTAADVVVQPYTDGISARRTSAMAPLAHGSATVSTTGALTEPFWAGSGAVALAPAADPQAVADAAIALLGDAAERGRLGAAGRSYYEARFSVERAVRSLLTEEAS
jgi:glycosyltransferase involved in cell wall biosynthesis